MKTVLVGAVAAAAAATAMPAVAAPSADSSTSFTAFSGALDITAPATVNLGSFMIGSSPAVSFGDVKVVDGRGEAPTAPITLMASRARWSLPAPHGPRSVPHSR
jgi:hypothetical protein